MKLTESQREAIQATDRRIAVVACPGSGKTTVLTRRIEELIRTRVSPQKICALTFTNKAAKEIKARLGSTYEKRKVFTGTFHGFALKIIRDFGSQIGLPHSLTIYDEKDRDDIIQSILKETGRKVPKKDLKAGMKNWTNNIYVTDKKVRPVLEEYFARLKAQHAMDFDTMMTEAVNVLALLPQAAEHYHNLYEHFLIDEAQDTDITQGELISCINPQNIFYVADIDQCIYEWRSAKPQLMIGMLRDPNFKVIRLEESHRCTKQVAEVANAVITKNTNRFEKDIKTDKEGPPVRWLSFKDRWEESEFIWGYVAHIVETMKAAPKEIFVMARTNRQLKHLSRVYHSIEGRPFEIDDLSIQSDMWAADSVRGVIHSLKLLINPRSSYLAQKSVFAIGKQAEVLNILSRSIFNDTHLLAEMKGRDPVMASFFSEFSPYDDVFKAVRWLAHFESNPLKMMGLEKQEYLLWDFVDYIFNWRAESDSSSIESFLEWHSIKTLQDGLDIESDKVKLMTVHAAKGLEAEYVILAGLNKGTFPSSRSDIEEERRLFYVAATRAKERLVACYETENPGEFAMAGSYV